MNEVQPPMDDEIDLVELFQTIWDGKWQIIGACMLSGVVAVGVLLNIKSWFTATTEIKPITTVQADRYSESNALGFFEVTREDLQELFIEQLDARELFVDAVNQYSLLKAEDFDSQAEFEAEVLEFSESISLLPPVNVDGTERGAVRLNWSVSAEYFDDEQWALALKYVKAEATKAVREILKTRFTSALEVARQRREFTIEDLDVKIENAQRDYDKEMAELKLRQTFELEDVEMQINNALSDYERKTSDRLAFLTEQASIARKLGVAKNTIEAQTFGVGSGMVANVKTDTPFYLRGYEAIEKEIDLISSRENKNAFVTGLLGLEQKKRSILQDQTLERADQEKQFLDDLLSLERQIRELEQDKTLERAERLFKLTPVWTGESFAAVSMVVEGTEYTPKTKKLLILVLVVMLTGMIAVIYVLIANAMKKRKQPAEV